MSVEPHGIGIERSAAIAAGIRPVVYDSNADAAKSEGWLHQSPGSITDWSNEREYRYLGDLSLKSIPTDKLALFCRYLEEAKAMEREFGARVPWFELKRDL